MRLIAKLLRQRKNAYEKFDGALWEIFVLSLAPNEITLFLSI